jgi:hypothetical protein
VVTYDASPEAGAAEHCRSNTRKFFELLLGSKEDEGLWDEVTDVFKLCKAPQSAQDVENVAYWVQVHIICNDYNMASDHISLASILRCQGMHYSIRAYAQMRHTVQDIVLWRPSKRCPIDQGAYDAFAMGNYPYPSSYMGGALPAWPMRAACQHLSEEDMSWGSLLKVCPTTILCQR